MSDQEQQQDAVNTQEQTHSQAGLTLQDLIVFAQIIQACNSRGAFRTEELVQVGTLYNKLITFLQISGAIVPSQPEEKEDD